MVDAKDIIFQQFDGNKIFCIDDGNFVSVGGNATAPGEIRIYEDTDNGTHYTGFKAGNNTASVAYVLPTADGTSGHQLTTDGSGTLSWSSAGTTLANDANNRVVTGTGSGLNGEANLTFDGSTLAVTGAITGSSDLTLQDDLILDSDAAVLSFGEDNEITLTHVADTGLLLNGASVIQFRDSAINIGSPADGDLDINADDEVEINSTLIDVNGNLDVSGTIVGASTLSATTITASTAFVPDASDGAALGTTALEFSDLFLADAAVIALGADQDVTLTHVADTGILLNGTNVIQFNDASQNIGAPSATVLDINATDEIELNATLVDINANVEISGTATTTGVHTFTAVPVFPNNTIETADIQADAITAAKIADNAVVTAGINADAVTGAKIADDAINSEHYTDGSIDEAHIADNAVAIAKIKITGETELSARPATGDEFVIYDASASANRRINYANLQTGKILQVVYANTTTEKVVSSATFVDTGLSASITPSSTSSKVLVICEIASVGKAQSNTRVRLKLLKGSSDLITFLEEGGENGSNDANKVGNSGCTYLDSPNTTSEITFKVQMNSGAGSSYGQTGGSGATSTMTLMEVAG